MSDQRYAALGNAEGLPSQPTTPRERLATDLAALPRWYRACEQQLRLAGRPIAEKVRGGRPGGFSLNEAAVDARAAILGVLTSWAAMTMQELGVRGPARREVGELAAFLDEHLDWLADHPAATDFAEEIAELGRAAANVVHATPSLRLELGECDRPDCGRPVFALGATGDGRPPVVRCAAGHVWQPYQWLRLANRLAQPQRAEVFATLAKAA